LAFYSPLQCFLTCLGLPAIQLDDESTFNWYYKGFLLDELKRYEEALQAYNRIQEADSPVWHNKGITLANLKRYEQAIAAYDKAIQINEYVLSYKNLLNLDIADSWYARGIAFFAIKRYQEAISSFDKALSLRSNFADAIKARSIAQKWLR
jgi:tetratricopeptide (TPR) repeat protein